jgi:hypothetical protein
LAVEQAFGRDVRDGVVVVDVTVDAFAVVGKDAVAEGGVANARASEGVEGDVVIGEAAEREDGECGAGLVAPLRLRGAPEESETPVGWLRSSPELR